MKNCIGYKLVTVRYNYLYYNDNEIKNSKYVISVFIHWNKLVSNLELNTAWKKWLYCKVVL